MSRQSRHALALFGFMLTTWSLSRPMMGQTKPVKSQASLGTASPFKPVPLNHLYWHFLTLQNYLDTKSAELESNHQDGSGARNNLQKQLGWSDEDYASIRTSSVRLTAELNDLTAQAVTIQTGNTSSSSHERLQALTAQRETSINAEITFLRHRLPPDKIQAFETFLIQFFAPKYVPPQPSSAIKSSIAGRPVPAAVQK